MESELRQPCVTTRPFAVSSAMRICFLADACASLFQKGQVRAASPEGRAADDDLLHAQLLEAHGAANRANTAAYAHLHFVFVARFDAKLPNERIVVAFAHGGVEVDHVQPLVARKAIKQAQHIGDGEFAFAPVN